ncbi:MAG: hypothetical protein H7Y42_03590 [Chitinophagaceae bacterium]|nr:hypothetical protein [Chitinophagaceae bacterium]
MHPRIKELFELLKNVNPEKILDPEVLYYLKEHGATRTEATITLHLGFRIDSKVADDFVICSKVWEPESPNDVFYQTLKYVYYNPDDPTYEADDNSVRIPL